MTENALAIFQNQSLSEAPDYITDGALGSENIGAEDQAIPQIKLLQGLSPEVAESLVDGARPGMFINSVTRELYHDVLVINLMQEKEYGVFKLRKFGGGIMGNYPTLAEAEEARAELDGDVSQYEITETVKHVLVLIDAQTGEAKQPAAFYCSNSKLAFSRNWNTQLSQTNGSRPRFSTAWRLLSKPKKNDKGSYFVPDVECVGWLPEDMYEGAKKLYETFNN